MPVKALACRLLSRRASPPLQSRMLAPSGAGARPLKGPAPPAPKSHARPLGGCAYPPLRCARPLKGPARFVSTALAKPRKRWLYGAANVMPVKALACRLLSRRASEDVSLMRAVARGDTRPLTRPREIRCRSSP